MTSMASSFIGELVLPASKPKKWDFIRKILTSSINDISDVDTIITSFAALDAQNKICTFFSTIPCSPPKEVKILILKDFIMLVYHL